MHATRFHSAACARKPLSASAAAAPPRRHHRCMILVETFARGGGYRPHRASGSPSSQRGHAHRTSVVAMAADVIKTVHVCDCGNVVACTARAACGLRAV